MLFHLGSPRTCKMRGKVGFGSFFVKFFGLAFFNGYGVLRAMAYAGAEAVAEEIAYKARLAVYDLQGAFRAVRYA